MRFGVVHVDGIFSRTSCWDNVGGPSILAGRFDVAVSIRRAFISSKVGGTTLTDPIVKKI
ncbi:hypothetical protein B0H19DRAFT_1156100 [Mycena capillaripes]|nr:hypothetical protein B0H19DRAFT_1156100 [Mycena capillaripes]